VLVQLKGLWKEKQIDLHHIQAGITHHPAGQASSEQRRRECESTQDTKGKEEKNRYKPYPRGHRPLVCGAEQEP
jgi:hypothetical protein